MHLALLDHRNTPTQGMSSSPAQRLMNRRTKTLLPATENLLRPQVPDQEEQQRLLRKRQLTQAHYYNRTAQDLPKLEIGDVVRMKPISNYDRVWRKATVAQKVHDRSYVVETPEGGTYRRNRYHLRKTGESAPPRPVDPIAVTPEEKTVGLTPQHEDQPATSSSSPATPTPTVPAQVETHTRPTRDRRPPSYFKDYVCY